MDRVTLGIIMPGNRRCILKENKLQKFFAVVAKFSWLYYLVAVATVFFLYKVMDDNTKHTFARYCDILFNGAVFAFVGWFTHWCYYSDKARCPCCKHMGQMRRISDNKLIDSKVDYVSRTVDDYSDGMAYNFDGDVTFYTNHSQYTEWDKKTTNTYTYNMRCRTCGCVVKVKEKRTLTN